MMRWNFLITCMIIIFNLCLLLLCPYYFWLPLIYISWINFLNPIVFRLMIIVVKTILTFYWSVLLSFCVFVCQGSWSLVTSRVFINDDSERNEASVIEVWGDFNSPFFRIYLTLPSEPEGSIPSCCLPCHSLGLCSFLEIGTIIKIEMKMISSHSTLFFLTPYLMQEIVRLAYSCSSRNAERQLTMTFQYSSRHTQL